MTTKECLFCDYNNPSNHTLILDNEIAYARWDNFPVSDGHAEIIPKRHVESFFKLTEDEIIAIYGLSKQVREIVDERYHPNAYNLGVNDGEAAGRTVHHCHLHLIPRYIGDVANPRGGIRHIIPEKGNY